MSIAHLAAMAGLVIYLLTNLVASVWWASRVTTTLENIQKTLEDDIDEMKRESVKREMEIKREAEKREADIKAIWTRLDEMREIISAKISEHHKNCTGPR